MGRKGEAKCCASCIGNSGHCGGERLIHNHLGEVIAAFSAEFGARMNNEAELRAVHDDIMLCCELGFQHVDIECD